MAGMTKLLGLLFLILAFISGLIHLLSGIFVPLVSFDLLAGFTLQMLIGLLTVILAGMQLLPMIIKK